MKRLRYKLRNAFFRLWYWYVSEVDKNAEVTFMNYGFSKNGYAPELDENDLGNRYSIQLYDYVAKDVFINGKDILEVGCGRGGGLSYIRRYKSPKSATGLDLNQKAIEFCQQYYMNERSAFVQGNAENMPFQNNSFDVIINVESSHRYAQMESFIDQVYRILKPGGFLLFADFRNGKELEYLNFQFVNANFEIVEYEIITTYVLESLKLSTVQRVELIKRLAPEFLHNLAKNFAATVGTPTYNKFVNRQFEYVFYILRKKE